MSGVGGVRGRRLRLIAVALPLNTIAIGLIGGLAINTLDVRAYRWKLVIFAALGLLVIVQAWLLFRPEDGRGAAKAANRHYLTILDRVDAVIAKRLRDSLPELVRIELDLVTFPADFPIRPEVLLRREDQEGTRLAGGIVEAWEESQNSLLLLGAPGAGKTTMLQELASDLAATARRASTFHPGGDQDRLPPIPILVDLADWRARRLGQARRRFPGRRRRGEEQESANRREIPANQDPIDWLVSWLSSAYPKLRPGVAHHWLENDGLVLLFDGLDEIPDNDRAAFIDWLNALCAIRPGISIAVVSRTREFTRLQRPLELRAVAEIRPLTREKVEFYLRDAGPSVTWISAALAADERLWELLNAPIWLLIITLTGRNSGVSEVVGSVEEGRQRLLEAFVAKVLDRRRPADRYTAGQTVRWLAQLARFSRWDLRVSRVFMAPLNEEAAWASAGVAAVSTVAAGVLSLPLARSYGLMTTLLLGVLPLGFLIFRSTSAARSQLVFPCIGLAFGLIIVRMEQGTIPWFRARFASISVGWMMKSPQGGDPNGVGGQLDIHRWITEGQFKEFMVIFLPGVIAVMATYVFFLWRNLDYGHHSFGLPFLLCTLISVAPFVIALSDHAPVFGPFLGYFQAGCGWALPALLGGAIVALSFTTLRMVLKPATAYFGYAMTACATFVRHFSRGRVPLRLGRFLRQATDHHLLIRDHTGYRFAHALLRDYFAQLDPTTATAPPPPAPPPE